MGKENNPSITKISASAGAGKTHTLTGRFLDLLRLADPDRQGSGCLLQGRPEAHSLGEILAATFTNKAAAEMKERVIATLKEEALFGHGPQKAQAALWVDNIIKNFSSLNIKTIDSLLNSLVRLSAMPLGISPDFAPSFKSEDYFTPYYDSLMQDLKNPSESPNAFLSAKGQELQTSLERASHNLVVYAGAKGFASKNMLHDKVCELVDMLLQGQELPRMDPEDLWQMLAKYHVPYKEAAKKLLTAIATEKLGAHKTFLGVLPKIADSKAFEPPSTSAFLQKASLDEVLNSKSKGTASDEALGSYRALQDSLQNFSMAQGILLAALNIAPLVPLAEEVYARMQNMGEGLVPNSSMPSLAAKALTGELGASEAMCRLGARLKHILLDEFQDTSREQWSSLKPLVAEALSTGGSFTYVGDVKQAIYSWRGGDARLFTEVEEEVELRAMVPLPKSLPLDDNWRSTPEIIEFNNHFFMPLGHMGFMLPLAMNMLPNDTPETYARATAMHVTEAFAQVEQNYPAQKLHKSLPKSPKLKASGLDAGAGQTEYLQALPKKSIQLFRVQGRNTQSVQEAVKSRLYRLCIEELFPRLEFRQVAFLVRSGDDAALLAEWLTDWGYPVVTENSLLLASSPLISRLTAFLRFLDYPQDDLAFWEFVTAEECFGKVSGLSAELLEDWLAKTKSTHTGQPLYMLWQKAFPDLWRKWIAPFFNQAGLMSAYDMLFECINRFDLFREEQDKTFLLRLLEVAHMSEAQGTPSLAGFLALWENLQAEEKLPLPENMNAIRIMTMHKAKGLAFDVVIVPFLDDSRHTDSAIIQAELDGTALLTTRQKATPEAFYSNLSTRTLEILNLLYVSFTRPKQELYAFVLDIKSKTSPLVNALLPMLDKFQAHEKAALAGFEHLDADAEEDAQEAYPLPEEQEVSWQEAQEYFMGQGVEQGPWQTPERIAASNRADSALMDKNQQSAEQNSGDASQAPDNWRPMQWLPTLKIHRSTLYGAELTPERKGVLAHLCLEHLVFSSATIQSAGAERKKLVQQDVQRAIGIAMRLFPLPLALPEEAATSMLKSLSWFAEQPEAPLWLGNGQRERGLLDATGQLRRTDLLVDLGKEGLLTVDYKTGQKHPDHQEQVQAYMHILEQAQSRPVSGRLVYLDLEEIDVVTTIAGPHAPDPMPTLKNSRGKGRHE